MKFKLSSALVATSFSCVLISTPITVLGDSAQPKARSAETYSVVETGGRRATQSAEEKFEKMMIEAPTAAGPTQFESREVQSKKWHTPHGTRTWDRLESSE